MFFSRIKLWMVCIFSLPTAQLSFNILRNVWHVRYPVSYPEMVTMLMSVPWKFEMVPRLSRSFVVTRSQFTKKTIHYQTISERWQEPKTPCTWIIRESYTNNGKNNARSCEKESYKIANKNESHEGRKINALIKLSLRKFRHCVVRAKTMPLTIVSHWRVLFEYTYTRFYYMYVLHIVLAIWLAIQVRLLSCLAFVSLFSCCCCCYLDPFTDFAVFLLGMRMYRMDCEWISSMD